MVRSVLFLLVLVSFVSCFGQSRSNKDSIEKQFSQLLRHSKRIKQTTDSSRIVIQYTKGDGIFRIAQLDRQKNVYYHFLQGQLKWISLNAINEERKKIGRANYYFTSGHLIHKEEDEFIQKDYSFLFPYAITLLEVSQTRLNNK